MNKERIGFIEGSRHDWRCVCRNTANMSGFYACNEEGNEIEPTKEAGWTNLMVCASCGRIINNDTGEIAGQNKDFKLLP